MTKFTRARYFLCLLRPKSAVSFCSITEPGNSATTAMSIASVPPTKARGPNIGQLPVSGPSVRAFTKLISQQKDRIAAISLISTLNHGTFAYPQAVSFDREIIASPWCYLHCNRSANNRRQTVEIFWNVLVECG